MSKFKTLVYGIGIPVVFWCGMGAICYFIESHFQ